MGKIYVGQVGALISLDTEDAAVSGADTLEIRYRKPDGATGAWPATLSGEKLEYTTTANDLDVAGQWALQAYAASGTAAWSLLGETYNHIVFPTFG